MSKQALLWARAQKIKPTQKAVLTALASCHTDEKGCFPSQNTIGDITGYARSTINVALKALEERTLISRVSGSKLGRRTTVYTLNMPIEAIKTDVREPDSNRPATGHKPVRQPDSYKYMNIKYRNKGSQISQKTEVAAHVFSAKEIAIRQFQTATAFAEKIKLGVPVSPRVFTPKIVEIIVQQGLLTIEQLNAAGAKI